MSTPTFSQRIAALLAESLERTANRPIQSGQLFMPPQSASLAQIEAIAREGLAGALLNQLRRRRRRVGLWKDVNLDRAFPATQSSRPANFPRAMPAASSETQTSAGIAIGRAYEPNKVFRRKLNEAIKRLKGLRASRT